MQSWGIIFGFLIFIVGLGTLFWYSWFKEPAGLEVTRHTIVVESAILQRPVRLLFLSDLHCGRFNNAIAAHQKIERLIALQRKERVDAVLLGGDYLDTEKKYLSELLHLIGQLKRMEVPIYAVLGNHDYRVFENDPSVLVRSLEEIGVITLINQGSILQLKGQKLAIIGLDELEGKPEYVPLEGKIRLPFAEYKKRAERVDWYRHLDHFAPGLPRVVMVHNPDGVYMPGVRPALVLSGHTHGGQIMVLDWISRFVPSLIPRGSFRTWAGRQEVAGTTLLVGRGFDGSAIPSRLMRSPQALIVTLHPAQSQLGE